MEIYQIIHFIAVVETGSFTKGADRVPVSQSAISTSIAKLEVEFGVQLLDRRRNPVVPTDAGERLLEAGKAILQICNTTKRELEASARQKCLRIGILQSISSRHVSKLVGSFRRINAKIDIEVCDAPSEQLLEMLVERQLDAIFTILDDSTSRFASRVLFKESYVLAVPIDHRFARQESVTLTDLHGESFIVRTGRDRFKDASSVLVSHGIKIRVVYKTSQIDRALALVAAGVGISFIPTRFVTPAIKQVRVANMDFSRTFGLVWSREPEGDLNEFITFAERHCWTD